MDTPGGGTLPRSANAPDPEHVRAVLARSPLFGLLPDDVRAEVAGLLDYRFLIGGRILFRPGDPSDALYLVVHGRLRVFLDIDASGVIEADEVVDDVTEGGVVGDVAVVSDDLQEALVVAVRDSEIGRLEKATLWALVERHPDLLRRLGSNAVRRLRSAFRPPLQPNRTNIAIVPADDGGSLRRFAEGLARALTALASVQYVNAERFEQELGAGASTDDVDRWDEVDRRAVRWMADQEARNRFVVYEAQPDFTPWTRRCIRMADRVLVLARASADPMLSAGERALYADRDASDLVGIELVLLHDDEAPSSTREWLTRRPNVRRVHHVGLSRTDTFERLARFLAGRAVGVVFGGGGARSTAQMGAVAALRDVGIPVDRVGGTSAGGGVAAMVAMGWDLETMCARNEAAFVRMAPFRHYTLPFYSMIQKRRLHEVARFLYGDTLIEDLWLRMYCVSCDLVSGRMVVHREGEVWRAVLATTALPGVLPPMVWDGRLLVDGGVMDNNPVAAMRSDGDGPVVLIDVGHVGAPLVEPADLSDLPSPAMAMWHRFKPFGRHVRVPTIPEILVRTMTVARPVHDVVRISDLYVRPDVARYGLTDFDSQPQLVALGYNATMEALEARATDERFLERFGLRSDQLTSLPRKEVPKRLPARR